MKSFLLAVAILTCSSLTFAQVGIGTTTPDNSTVLDIVSSNKGFLPPRLASDANVTDPAEGLVIYDESDDCLNVFDGNSWVNLCDASNGAGGTGDGTTNPPVAGQNLYSWGPHCGSRKSRCQHSEQVPLWLQQLLPTVTPMFGV